MDKLLLALQCNDSLHFKEASALAESLHVPFNESAEINLIYATDGLSLSTGLMKPVKATFDWHYWNKRRQEGGAKLISACKPEKGVKILDLTAGLGRDAALLAVYGATVTMIERNLVMHALLDDALQRRSERDREKLDLTLVQNDAHSFLTSLIPEDYPDIIYFDPMHPERAKSALVKKDMQLLQRLLGESHYEETESLLLLALSKVKKRVVMKWPTHETPLLKPDWFLGGKTVQFNVYLPK